MYVLMKKWDLLDNFNLFPVEFYFSTSLEEKKKNMPSASEINNVVRELDNKIRETSQQERKKFLNRWKGVALNLREFENTKNDSPCLVPWLSTYITAHGDVIPCCYLIEKQIMGNIYADNFKDIWNNKKYVNFRRRLKDVRINLEGCNVCRCNHTKVVNNYKFISFWMNKWRYNTK